MATQSSPVVKQSLLEKLTCTVYLDYVLKVLGIVMLALALFRGWSHLPLLDKFLLISGPIAWYVGARFDKIYR